MQHLILITLSMCSLFVGIYRLYPKHFQLFCIIVCNSWYFFSIVSLIQSIRIFFWLLLYLSNHINYPYEYQRFYRLLILFNMCALIWCLWPMLHFGSWLSSAKKMNKSSYPSFHTNLFSKLLLEEESPIISKFFFFSFVVLSQDKINTLLLNWIYITA